MHLLIYLTWKKKQNNKKVLGVLNRNCLRIYSAVLWACCAAVLFPGISVYILICLLSFNAVQQYTCIHHSQIEHYSGETRLQTAGMLTGFETV